jgi:DNA-binding NtrC family response regulator
MMRNLVVLSPESLPAAFEHDLFENRWRLTYVRNAEFAQDLTGNHEFLVGLALFPDSSDTLGKRFIQQTIALLSHVKWIGALPREELSDILVRRFIAERLYDFQVFPLHADRLAMAIGHAHGMAEIEREFRRTAQTDWPVRRGLIGESAVMQELFRVIQHAAVPDVAVLITGPTGTGKEKVAHAIHDLSPRANGPFVALNCAAIPPSLLQSELFGHVAGAFTDAVSEKIGHIETASGGTLFLDEIGDMPFESQATLLRFLEDKKVTPLGSTRTKEADVRVIASTNKDLEAAIGRGEFRADLFYRLAVLTVRTPSLSLRQGDIELLANHFLKEAIAAIGAQSDLRYTNDAIAALQRYAWPGNLRELRSCVFQATVLCTGRHIGLKHLNLPGGPYLNADPERMNGVSLQDTRNRFEKQQLELSLAMHGSNVARTAKKLGISRMTLYRLMAKHGVSRIASA